MWQMSFLDKGDKFNFIPSCKGHDTYIQMELVSAYQLVLR